MSKAAVLKFDFKSTIMLLLLAAVWGGSFFFGEVALREVPPLTITLHRVVWALPILAVIVFLNGIAIPRSSSVWAAHLVMGALNHAIPFSLIFWGQTQIESGLASILNGTTAMFAAVVAGLLLVDLRASAISTMRSGSGCGASFGTRQSVLLCPSGVFRTRPRRIREWGHTQYSHKPVHEGSSELFSVLPKVDTRIDAAQFF